MVSKFAMVDHGYEGSISCMLLIVTRQMYAVHTDYTNELVLKPIDFGRFMGDMSPGLIGVSAGSFVVEIVMPFSGNVHSRRANHQPLALV